jgi:hypothetical protein
VQIKIFVLGKMSSLRVICPHKIKSYLDEIELTKIRLGNKMDGGYVFPKELISWVNKLVSIGIGADVSFEKHFIEAHKEARNIVSSPDSKDSPVSLTSPDSEKVFRLGSMKIEYSDPEGELDKEADRKMELLEVKVVKETGLKTWLIDGTTPFVKSPLEEAVLIRMNASATPMPGHLSAGEILNLVEKDEKGRNKGLFVLKFDIEGAEWDIFNASEGKKLLEKADVIIMELHFLHNDGLGGRYDALLKLLDQHFVCFHLHANNAVNMWGISCLYHEGLMIPRLLELTLINRRHVKSASVDPQPCPGEHDERNAVRYPEVYTYFWKGLSFDA